MPRPTRCTPARTRKICDALRSGNTMAVSAGAGGISESALYEWLARGKSGEAPFAKFLEEATRARGEAEAALLATITRHSAEDWRAAAWIMERRYTDAWALRSRIDSVAEQKSAAMIDHLLGAVSNEAKLEIISILYGADGPDDTKAPEKA